MKVVVVGATGNVGTAVLRALSDEARISAIVGVARRLPDQSAAPYSAAEWRTFDIGQQAFDEDGERAVVDELADVFAGADAVIHLAWLIQPNHDRDLMRRTNVDGTARIAQACVQAGVRQLVCASSWAAYSPVADDVARDESWPHGGIRSSHYSVDKAAQERVLDDLEASHPEIAIARMRTALVFDAEAGAEIVRYFLGPYVPLALLQPGALPLLPLPTGLRLHVVHAEDVAQAYVQAVLQRARGAFNVAADDVLWPADVAKVLDHGRYVEISPRLIRPFLHYAWRARLSASDAGWLDMAMGVPVMAGSRVRQELGWAPKHSAADTLRQMLRGMVERRGMPSDPMRPHDTRYEGAPSAGAQVYQGGSVPAHLDRGLLSIYLSDHLSGAAAGLSRVRRMADSYGDSELGPDLQRIAADIAEEYGIVEGLIHELGLHQRRYRQALAWTAEHLGRLKLNKRVLRTSPVSVLLELELLRSAVIGKLGGWQTLTELAGDLGLEPSPFEDLARRAREQAGVLDRLHQDVSGRAFRLGEAPD